MSRYDGLRDHLRLQTGPEFSLTFREIEKAIGGRLPKSADHPQWWANVRDLTTTHDRQSHPIVTMARTVAHTADVAPRLARHQSSSLVTQPECGLANLLQAPFDRIARAAVTLKLMAVHADNI
jgi:hypothetical protein